MNELSGVPMGDVRVDRTFADPGVDDMAMVGVAAAERFDVSIPDQYEKQSRTVGDLADYILSHQV